MDYKNDMGNLEVLKTNVREIISSSENTEYVIDKLRELRDDLQNECRIIHDLLIDDEIITFNTHRYREIDAELMDCISFLNIEIKGLERR